MNKNVINQWRVAALMGGQGRCLHNSRLNMPKCLVDYVNCVHQSEEERVVAKIQRWKFNAKNVELGTSDMISNVGEYGSR